MIQKIKISNFKSIEALELDLGRVNVFIGENGCGKTNILEAIAFGSLGFQNKLDHEFLYARGIRMPQDMGAFYQKNEPAKIQFQDSAYQAWLSSTSSPSPEVSGNSSIPGVDNYEFWLDKIEELRSAEKLNQTDHFKRNQLIFDFFSGVFKKDGLFSFINFNPEYKSLASFTDAGQILPLGIDGAGLFRELQKIIQSSPEKWAEIKSGLEAIDWFQDLEIPKDLFLAEKRIQLKDRYLGQNPEVQYLDQRSANEGFLFLLFYFTLFTSEETPRFFAIDNIDQALNPRLCIRLIQTLSQMAKKHNKQVILTTHNPSVLDGLDLKDDEQRLHVVYRNADGNTVAKRYQPKENTASGTRLSEAFIRGYLGGLPKHF
jgi:predicted ATPase